MDPGQPLPYRIGASARYHYCLAGAERQRWTVIRQVPLNQVDTRMCQYDYGVKGASYAAEHVENPGVYTLHCRDGETFTVGKRW